MARTQQASLADLQIGEIMCRAHRHHVIIPAFNVPYLPMLKPIVDMLKEHNSFGLIQVARPDVEKFEARSFAAAAEEYAKHADAAHTRLHLDHTPVIDEDGEMVDWESIIREALSLGFDSVMLDGSRLPLEENIRITKAVVDMSSPSVPVEAELGAVLGHESGPVPPYEELFSSGKGFTDIDEAVRFVTETGVDWLSVAIGNIHGAISGAAQHAAKVEARLDIAHLKRISSATRVPLVLHGGSGINLSCVLNAAANGITKINVGTALRHAYEGVMRDTGDLGQASKAVAQTVTQHLTDYGIMQSAGRRIGSNSMTPRPSLQARLSSRGSADHRPPHI